MPVNAVSEDQAIFGIVPQAVVDSRWSIALVDVQTVVSDPLENSLGIPAEEPPLPALHPVPGGVPVVVVPVVVAPVVIQQEVVDEVLYVQLFTQGEKAGGISSNSRRG